MATPKIHARVLLENSWHAADITGEDNDAAPDLFGKVTDAQEVTLAHKEVEHTAEEQPIACQFKSPAARLKLVLQQLHVRADTHW